MTPQARSIRSSRFFSPSVGENARWLVRLYFSILYFSSVIPAQIITVVAAATTRRSPAPTKVS